MEQRKLSWAIKATIGFLLLAWECANRLKPTDEKWFEWLPLFGLLCVDAFPRLVDGVEKGHITPAKAGASLVISGLVTILFCAVSWLLRGGSDFGVKLWFERVPLSERTATNQTEICEHELNRNNMIPKNAI